MNKKTELDKQFNTAIELDDYRDSVDQFYYKHDIEGKPAFINEKMQSRDYRDKNNE